ncbi:MAG: glutathione peroxidase [Bradymonadales bacterium]|nr:MAG: glutathione peroxidase [Bradymonadales bacterium]
MLNLLVLSFLFGAKSSDPSPSPEAFLEIFDLPLRDLEGGDLKLSNFKGEVLMIVNTASRCGFTKQYAELQKLYQSYQDQGFRVIGVPSNDFGGQEPGSNEEIRIFCQENYQVSFPMLERSAVRSEPQSPLFQKLIQESERKGLGGSVRWNFEKFLVDRQGRLMARYRSMTSPKSRKITREIERLLSEPARL